MNKENAGYQILKETRVDDSLRIVLGYNESSPQGYVVWYCNNDDEYFWGNYSNEKDYIIDKFISLVSGLIKTDLKKLIK